MILCGNTSFLTKKNLHYSQPFFPGWSKGFHFAAFIKALCMHVVTESEGSCNWECLSEHQFLSCGRTFLLYGQGNCSFAPQ